MNSRTKTVLAAIISFIAGGCTCAAIVGYFSYKKISEIEAQFRADWELVPVIVFNSGLPSGAALDYEHVAKMLLPRTFVTPNLVLPGRYDEVLGKKLRVSTTRGDLLLWSMVDEGDSTGWELKQVVVFNRELKEGTAVTREQLSMMNMPVRFITPGMVRPEKAGELIGKKIQVPVKPGDLAMGFMFEK
jgi:Flp pilus assembly protein CpaB